MGIISVEQIDRLYWLGRYSERVYTTLRLYFSGYDRMIDERIESYREFCKKIDIPDVYGSKDVFKEKYAFDETDPNSIFSNLNRAYDNAIVLREEIGSETLSYIQLAIYDMHKAKISRAPLIEMQSVIDNILAFWGIADDSIDSEQIRNIIKVGKRIERIDLYSRLKIGRKEIVREVHRLTYRLARCGIKYNTEKTQCLEELIGKDTIDYDKVLALADTILEV